MEIHLKIVGTLFILLAAIHVIFPRYFKWKTELPRLSLVNAEMMVIHTLFLALVVLMMGILCVTSSGDLAGTPFGQRICLGLAIFWTLRFFVQFFGYSSSLWKGKIFETGVHIVFSLFWGYASVVFWLCGVGPFN